MNVNIKQCQEALGKFQARMRVGLLDAEDLQCAIAGHPITKLVSRSRLAQIGGIQLVIQRRRKVANSYGYPADSTLAVLVPKRNGWFLVDLKRHYAPSGHGLSVKLHVTPRNDVAHTSEPFVSRIEELMREVERKLVDTAFTL